MLMWGVIILTFLLVPWIPGVISMPSSITHANHQVHTSEMQGIVRRACMPLHHVMILNMQIDWEGHHVSYIRSQGGPKQRVYSTLDSTTLLILYRVIVHVRLCVHHHVH